LSERITREREGVTIAIEERQMRTRLLSILIAATALTPFQAVAGFGADECILKPNATTPPGGHWYYHVDPVKNRKCWFVRQENAVASPAPSPQVQSRTETAAQPSSPSLLSSLVSAFAPAPQIQEGTVSDSLSLRDTLPNQAPQTALNNLHRKRPKKAVRQSIAKSSETKVQDQSNIVLDRASRDALFREFLLWQERQNTVER